MFNTPKGKTNEEETSMMCPPPPTRSSSRALLSALSSSTSGHRMSAPSLALDSFFAEIDLSESSSPMKVDGFFLTPPQPPVFPSLSENDHQDPIKLQPRLRLSNANDHPFGPINLKPRPFHRRSV
ncbi:hypothetical protein QTG54_016553 [Skeletonema marinoi]|uniref:Uncharacterized protein n=1 Tax=Skeletonema marinoi TaxID=267567 RepID=A0AAD9D4L5_9STRA|nr:hypothetical protein QTG54_016553 [Skeletonema marinoi]